MSEIHTGGGAAISGNANAGRDLVGRDQNIFLTVINQFADESQKHDKDKDRAAALVAQWQAVDPAAAEARYRQSLIDYYNRLRIFGTSGEVALQNVFTDVYIFAEPLSRIPYDFDALRTAMAKETQPRLQHRAAQRVNGMQLVKEGKNLFILGKPGAGKTTFLKYLTVQAAQHKLSRLPIFISLNEWANSRWGKGNDPQLMPFIVHQFALCHFDGAEFFVEALLRSGQALVLFDGLDEVRQEDDQRRKLTQLLKDFARQYDRSQHLITCRIAASDYAFPGFRDVEVADFSDEQIHEYAELWFRTVKKSHETFLTELGKPENQGVRELCNSPLLLSMVCLYFERVMRFPPNRAELYEDAIEALLNKWDASRDILRDEIPHGETLYRELSPRRKEQMFAAIAARTFETGDYYFRRRDLEKWIGDYLRTLPNVKPDDDIDNNAVLRAIEAQHGIFVERATDIYSFSHLTFQEYFTARYIFDNERRGTTTRLLRDHLVDNRWREVFLLTVSLFDCEGADHFFLDLQLATKHLVRDPALRKLLIWTDTRAVDVNMPDEWRNAIRLAYIFLSLVLDLDRDLIRTRTRALARLRDRELDYALGRDLAIELERDLARSRESVRTLALDRALVQANAIERALSYSLDLARILNLARALDLARDRELSRTRTVNLAHPREQARALALNLASESTSANYLSIQIDLDYGLYYVWGYARLFTIEAWPRSDRQVQTWMATYGQLIARLDTLAKQANQPQLLRSVTIPTVTASPQGWQQCADQLYAILHERDLIHDWHFTAGQVDQLNAYFYTNELLVQCLNVAVVSDRQAILAGLLAPPKGDKETGRYETGR